MNAEKEIGALAKNAKILKGGKSKGILIGGNLSVLRTLIGTPYEPNWKNKIIFWEEIDQTLQDIDFYLTW